MLIFNWNIRIFLNIRIYSNMVYTIRIYSYSYSDENFLNEYIRIRIWSWKRYSLISGISQTYSIDNSGISHAILGQISCIFQAFLGVMLRVMCLEWHVKSHMSTVTCREWYVKRDILTVTCQDWYAESEESKVTCQVKSYKSRVISQEWQVMSWMLHV